MKEICEAMDQLVIRFFETLDSGHPLRERDIPISVSFLILIFLHVFVVVSNGENRGDERDM